MYNFKSFVLIMQLCIFYVYIHNFHIPSAFYLEASDIMLRCRFQCIIFVVDYPDYPQYQSQPYDSHVKYEDEDEQKYEPERENTNGSRHLDEDYEEGEAY